MYTYTFSVIPATSAQTVIFPKGFSGFDSGSYVPIQTGGRAHIQEINQVLNELDAANKTKNPKILGAICLYIFLIFGIMILFILFIVFVAWKSTVVLMISIFGMIFGIFAVVFLLIKMISNANESAKNAAKAVVEKYQPAFESRGLRWHIPANFPNWVELHNDWRVEDFHAQNYYVPPVGHQYQNVVYQHQQPQPQQFIPAQDAGANGQYQNANYFPGYQNPFAQT